MKARIHILTWRQHGGDDDSTTIAVYAADDPTEALEELKRDYDIGVNDAEGNPLPDDYDAEIAEDWPNVVYVDMDATIEDGDIMEWKGRKFKISIAEVAA